jgi:hypothetical protein
VRFLHLLPIVGRCVSVVSGVFPKPAGVKEEEEEEEEEGVALFIN